MNDLERLAATWNADVSSLRRRLPLHVSVPSNVSVARAGSLESDVGFHSSLEADASASGLRMATAVCF